MTAIGVIGFDSGLVSRAVHPHRAWIDGWNFDPAGQHIRGVGDLSGDGRAEAVVTSDWGIGVLHHDGRGFRCPFGAPRDTMFGRWRYDATNRPGRDRIVAIGNFTGSAHHEVLVWSDIGLTTLARTATGLAPSRLHLNGTRLGGWVLSTLDNRYHGSGRFGADGREAMVLTSPWGLGLVSLQEGTSTFMAPTGSRLGDWTFRTDSDRIRLIADLDGDGQDEILISGRTGIAVLKLVDGALVSVAAHRTGANLSGYVLEGAGDFAVADRFRGATADEILVSDHRGLHVLALTGGGLARRAFTPNGTRVDGWVVDALHNPVLAAGDLAADTPADFVIRSGWGIGVMSVGADNRFRCRRLHPYGADLGGWRLDSSDVIAGVGRFTGGGRNELLVVKPSAGSAATPRFTATTFVNWHRNIDRTVPTVRPGNLTELVDAVRAIRTRAGVTGSGWSYTKCAVGDDTGTVIDTSGLTATLGGLLPDIVDDRAATVGSRLVHVEAGIKLFDLNCRLDRLGLALPTLGGSRGQSLAGVLGTGVHGADVSLPPIADAVRAIHLVAPGGQQWWIEPAFGSLTTKDVLDRARARGVLDPSIKNVYDDQWFNAALVAMGCAGVIYSVVLECRPAFRLRSTTTAESWSQAQRRIQDLAFADRRPRFLEINLNPSDTSCRVTVRNETTAAVRMPAASAGLSTGEIAAAVGLLGPAALGVLFAAVGDYVARTTAEITVLSLVAPHEAVRKTIEALQPVQDAHRLLIELNLAAVDPHDSRRVADVLPTAINLLWAIGAFIAPGRALVDLFQSRETDRVRPVRTFVGASFRVSTDQPSCGQDGAQNHDETERLIESFEYAVAASRAVAFVDRLLAVIRERRSGPDALVVNLNLRFTGRTRATLGMQKFDQTCHVEIYTFRGLRGNAAFKERLHEIVRDFDAVPHWGQLHAPAEARVVREDRSLGRWQPVIRALSDGNEMFWSDFARTRGLLP
ncbi:D-arabinono-1,4-lactone oxidase [Micromonospora sp. NPDC049799]|uniref:D-arabinono-1,4-lactone oxidase n=1 Tax=Micromonospora sp. NPDC049799 TaxID=3154741 RepID=UPI0033CAE6EC